MKIIKEYSKKYKPIKLHKYVDTTLFTIKSFNYNKKDFDNISKLSKVEKLDIKIRIKDKSIDKKLRKKYKKDYINSKVEKYYIDGITYSNQWIEYYENQSDTDENQHMLRKFKGYKTMLEYFYTFYEK